MDLLVLSYKNLRLLIGLISFILSLFCAIGGLLFGNFDIQDSISSYYYTNMRDYFVASLVSVGLFLLSYQGYDKLDRIISVLSGILLIGVAVFPTYKSGIDNIGIFQLSSKVSSIFHFICAGSFFMLMSVMSYFMFTKHGDSVITKQKIRRNKIYKSCGIIIFVSLLLSVLSYIIPVIDFKSYKFILIMETIMLFSFGISWMIKGGAMFKDQSKSDNFYV